MAAPGTRTTGDPASANGASSMHAWWEGVEPVPEVAVTLEVLVPPSVPRLHFWALQVAFGRSRGRWRAGGGVAGAAHLGLQAHPEVPGGTAVNWGGYRDAARGGGELQGSRSALPSATGNPHTRDLAWSARRPYRLRVVPGSGPGWWSGSVTDLTTGDEVVVRELHAVGTDELRFPVVWSEVFAPCDAPSSIVRWSSFEPPVAGVRVTYQSVADGGCSNSDTTVLTGAVVQATATARTVPHGSRLPLT